MNFRNQYYLRIRRELFISYCSKMPLKTLNKTYTKQSHDDNRKRVCLICLASNKPLVVIEGKLQAKVEEIVQFKIDNAAPTIVICTGCKCAVYAKRNINLPDIQNSIFAAQDQEIVNYASVFFVKLLEIENTIKKNKIK